MDDSNIIPHDHKIKRADREKKNNYRSIVIWFTGLSGSGKSSIASRLEEDLFARGFNTYILDGDNVRHGLNKDLGFSDEERYENLRRVSEVARLFVDAGIIVIAAFISPHKKERDMIKSFFKKEEFIEVFVDCPLEVCEKRDVKGNYRRYREGKIKNFVGIDIMFERPESPDVIIKSDETGIEESSKEVLGHVIPKIRFENGNL